MRRMFSRLSPRTKKVTSTAYRRQDVDHRRLVLLRRCQHSEARAPARPRPRTFLVYDSQPQSKPKPRPQQKPRGRDPFFQPFRRLCVSGRPVRTFLQPELGENDGAGCSSRQHLWRSRSCIFPGANSTSVSAIETCSSTSNGRRACTGSRPERTWNRVPRVSPVGGLTGSRTYRVEDLRLLPERCPEEQRPVSAPAVPDTSAAGVPAGVVSDGRGGRYRIRSFRYSRLHRRTIDAMVPEELKRLPQRWADRAAQVEP